MIAEAHTPSGHLLGLGEIATVLGFWRYAAVQRNHKNLEGPQESREGQSHHWW